MAILIMLIVLNTVIYLTAAFVMWHFNPIHWDGFARFLVALMSVMLDVVLIGAYVEWKSEN
jgi:hypothetical protein